MKIKATLTFMKGGLIPDDVLRVESLEIHIPYRDMETVLGKLAEEMDIDWKWTKECTQVLVGLEKVDG